MFLYSDSSSSLRRVCSSEKITLESLRRFFDRHGPSSDVLMGGDATQRCHPFDGARCRASSFQTAWCSETKAAFRHGTLSDLPGSDLFFDALRKKLKEGFEIINKSNPAEKCEQHRMRNIFIKCLGCVAFLIGCV